MLVDGAILNNNYVHLYKLESRSLGRVIAHYRVHCTAAGGLYINGLGALLLHLILDSGSGPHTQYLYCCGID